MRIGFSTGAIARGDYWTALHTLRAQNVRVVELSALRASELELLIGDIDRMPLPDFDFVSFHAPSKFDAGVEGSIINLLWRVADRGIPIVVHPDTMRDDQLWGDFGGAILIENMDKRKPIGRTAAEMDHIFKRFPQAGLCFDIGHARQVDPTMVEAYKILDQHGCRLKQIHMSEVNTA